MGTRYGGTFQAVAHVVFHQVSLLDDSLAWSPDVRRRSTPTPHPLHICCLLLPSLGEEARSPLLQPVSTGWWWIIASPGVSMKPSYHPWTGGSTLPSLQKAARAWTLATLRLSQPHIAFILVKYCSPRGDWTNPSSRCSSSCCSIHFIG